MTILQTWARLRSLMDGMRRSSRLDAEMKDEFATHIALRASDLARGGLSETEALRQARREFGIAANHVEQGRASRGLRRFDQLRVSLLDFKLGFRMLVRYPGLTAVAGLALAFAICVGSAAFEFLNQVARPSLPFENGDRIVAVRNFDIANERVNHRAAYDLSRWRSTLQTINNLSAYKTGSRNLIIDGAGTPLELAELSARTFTILQVPALLGRTLVATDELASAPPVAVIGFEVWQRMFNSDPSVVGRVVQLGRDQTTIVGVMPEGFAFPVAQGVWTPLKLEAGDFEPGAGPGLRIFGTLAEGARMQDAELELANASLQSAKDLPRTHEHLRAQVMPYTRSIIDISGWNAAAVLSSNLFVMMLVALVCANVALLMFARAATRESEMAVRAALGASRGRIVGQLFIEAAVLGVLASLVGLAVSRYAMQWGVGMVEAEMSNNGAKLPFWIRGGLAPLTVVYASALTLLGAVIAGVMPALKVTRGLGARLKHATAGAGGLRFGGVWTAVIVIQVAVTVTFPAASFLVRRDAQKIAQQPVGFATSKFLSARLDFERPAGNATPEAVSTSPQTEPAVRYHALKRRLLEDPSVAGVTFASLLPRMYHMWNQVESDGAVSPRDTVRGHRVARVQIDADYFEVLGVALLEGRAFNSSDVASSARVAIVNRTFADSVFGGRNPVGQRIRFVADERRIKLSTADSAWIEIVGVAPDMGTVSGYGQAGVYEPMPASGAMPVHIAMQTRGNPSSLAPRIRALATLHDPDLRLHQLQPLDGVVDAEVQFYAFWVRVTVMISLVALLLSLAAIYSVMSFTVSRRTREIGIRIALGSSVQAITLTIFRQPIKQIAWGVTLGGAFVALLSAAATGSLPTWQQGAAILAYTTVMTVVCALACIVPTRRALAVQPTEALRSDG